MRIGGVIVAIFFTALHQARTHDEGDERILEKISSAINDSSRFDRLVNLNLYDVSCDAAAVLDDGVLLYRSVFNMIPDEKLTDVPVSTWATLYDYFNEDVSFVSKVLDMLENDQRRIDFLADIRVVPFAANYCRNRLTVLQTMAHDLVATSANEENALDLLVRNRVLLFSAPSYFLLQLRDNYKVFLLAYAAAAADQTDAFWRQQSSLTKRTWSKILLEPNSRVGSLIKQQENFSFFQVLDTINVTELQTLLAMLDINRTISPAFFHSIDWNTIQIRKIVDFSFERFHNLLLADISGTFLSRLLPVQIVRVLRAEDISFANSEVATYAINHLQTVDQISLPQALQLSEHLIVPSNEASSMFDESNCALVGKLLYSQTNSFLSQLFHETLTMKIIKCLDSDKYSVLQAHYILGRNGLRDVNDYLLNLKGLLAAIPASFYVNLVTTSKRDGSLDNHFNHILKYFPSHANKVAASAALHACKTTIGYWRCIESVLENDNNEIVSMISPLHISQNRDRIWHFLRMKAKNENEFKQRVAHWPSFVLTELLRKKELVITYNQLFNETYPIHLAIAGLNCEILSRIPSTDFLPMFEFYNRQRKLYNKEFPKDLQKCAQSAFLRYLQMKSNAAVAPLKADLLQYLDLADIRSIGGYVLTTLPTKSITKSKHYRNIVEEIGRLSLPELMLAVTRRQLVSIASQYLNETAMVEQNERDVRVKHLITLGNLTHFLNDEYVRKIDASALRFLLEAEYIDTRVCASLAVRKAWADKLIEAFGSPTTWDENTFLKVDDMLIVMDELSFDAFNRTACSRVADMLKSKFKRSIEWIPRRLPFYKVCSVILPQNERASYESSVKRLAFFYATSIEQLLGTVVRTDKRTSNVDYQEGFARSENDAPQIHVTDFEGGDGHIVSTESTNVFSSNPVTTERTMWFSTSCADCTETATDKSTSSFVSRVSSSSSSSSPPSPKQIVAGTENAREEETVVADDSQEREKQDSYDTVVQIRTTISSSTEKIVTRFPPLRTSSLALFFSSHDAPTSPNTNDYDEFEDSRVVDDPKDQPRAARTVSHNVSTPSRFSFARDSFEMFTTNVAVDRDVNIASGTFASVSTEHTSAVSASSLATAGLAAGDTNADVQTSEEETTTTIITTAADLERDISSSASLPVTFEHNQPFDVIRDDEKRQLKAIVHHLLALASTSSSNAATDDTAQHKYRSKRDAAAGRKLYETNQLNVSCNTLKILDTMSDFILNSSLTNVSEEDVFDCIELLARMDNLSAERRKTIWYSVASKLSDKNLTFVAGKILSAASDADLHNFTYDAHSPGALELISSVSEVWSAENSEELVNRMLGDNHIYNSHNNNKANEFGKSIMLPIFTRALGKIICNVPNPMFYHLLKRDDDILADIWTSFHALNDCPMKCLERIASVAVKVYGEPLQWEPSIFTMLGPVVAALPKLFAHWNVTRYFSASAFECLRFSTDFVNVRYRINQQYLDSISLTSAMLLQDNDCVRGDSCSFTSSLASVVLVQDSLKLRGNSSHSTSSADISQSFVGNSSHSTSRVNISRPFAGNSSHSTSSAKILRPFTLLLFILIAKVSLDVQFIEPNYSSHLFAGRNIVAVRNLHVGIS